MVSCVARVLGELYIPPCFLRTLPQMESVAPSLSNCVHWQKAALAYALLPLGTPFCQLGLLPLSYGWHDYSRGVSKCGLGRQGGQREGAERPGLVSQPPPGHCRARTSATDLLGSAPRPLFPSPSPLESREHQGGATEVWINLSNFVYFV